MSDASHTLRIPAQCPHCGRPTTAGAGEGNQRHCRDLTLILWAQRCQWISCRNPKCGCVYKDGDHYYLRFGDVLRKGMPPDPLPGVKPSTLIPLNPDDEDKTA